MRWSFFSQLHEPNVPFQKPSSDGFSLPISEGSTRVAPKAAYLEALPVGAYAIEIRFADGSFSPDAFQAVDARRLLSEEGSSVGGATGPACSWPLEGHNSSYHTGFLASIALFNAHHLVRQAFKRLGAGACQPKPGAVSSDAGFEFGDSGTADRRKRTGARQIW